MRNHLLRSFRAAASIAVASVLVAAATLALLNAAPFTRAGDGFPRFLIDVTGDLSPAAFDLVKGAGAGGVRVYLSWRALEPADAPPERYRWGEYDDKFRALADRGLQPLIVVHDCPAWACESVAGPVREEHLDGFAEFMGAVAGRYSRPPFNAHYWELWNEPDSTRGPKGEPSWGLYGARYAAMLRAVRPAVKAADPEARIVLGGLAYDNFLEQGGPFNRRFLDDVLDAGGGEHFDIFAFHYYVLNANWCSFGEKLTELRGKLEARSLQKPLMCTETGWTSSEDFSSNDVVQSSYLAQVYAQSAGEDLLATAWFQLRDFSTDIEGWKVFEQSGLVDLAGKPKPSYEAYQAMVEQLSQRSPGRSLTKEDGLADGMRGYELSPREGDEGSLWVLWGWDLSKDPRCGDPRMAAELTIPAPMAAKVKSVLDLYGKPLDTVKRADGAMVLPLDVRPVYLQWEK